MLASSLGHYMAGCKLLYTQIQIQLLTKVWKLPLFRGTRIECYKGKYIEAMERHAILRLLNRKPLQYTTKERSVGMPHFLGTGQKITSFYKLSGATVAVDPPLKCISRGR